MAWRRSVMARTAPRPPPDREQVLETVHRACPACGGRLRYRYDNRHTVTTLIALVGAWRYREHRSVPEIHRGLRERGVAIAERTVTHLLDRGACPPAGGARPGGRARRD